jgi:hypothetical protein
MPKPVSPIRIELSVDEREELEAISRAQALPHRAVVRAKIILLLVDGESVSGVARALGQRRRIVAKWAHRFIKKRLRGLDDAARSGRPPRFSPDRRSASGEARV